MEMHYKIVLVHKAKKLSDLYFYNTFLEQTSQSALHPNIKSKSK